MTQIVVSKKTDTDIQQDVIRELKWDTRIEETDVGIEVDNGVVTLRMVRPQESTDAGAPTAILARPRSAPAVRLESGTSFPAHSARSAVGLPLALP